MPNRLAWRSSEAVMNETHLVYLNLGSNIQPEINLVRAVQLLCEYGEVEKISNAWETRSVGEMGPNYLNACALFVSPFRLEELKERVIRPVEEKLGRERSENKNAPRTIDIDIVLVDDKPYNEKFAEFAFVVVPLAEIYPEYRNPLTGENIGETAARLRRREAWMQTRPEVLSQLNRDSFKAQT